MRSVCVLLAVLAGLAGPGLAAAPRHFEDATLRCVQFVDHREGWAVGDEGVIWHTIDAGKHWERVPSATRASLRCVHFIDPYVGWIVGREELPGGGSAGVVLYTCDSGVTWRRKMAGVLPGLNAVHFTGPKVGYLAGDGSEQFPSGTFVTRDAGRYWEPLPGPRASSWRAIGGDAIGGAWNRLAKARPTKLDAINMDSLGGRTVTGLAMQKNDGVAVGQGGLVLLSRGSGGSAWDYARTRLPREVLASWDLHAVSFVGKQIRAVGRPGSAVLASDDAGLSWRILHTGQPMPLHGLSFHNDKLGWAVGELGTILHTADGGKTWQVQQRGGQRMAVLCVHGRPGRALPDVVAHLGGHEGYLTAGLCVGGPEPATASLGRTSEGHRFEDAFRQAGAAAAAELWQFPVGSHVSRVGRKRLLASWDKLHDGQAAQGLLGQLVLAIRTYRPEVVLTSGGDDALEALVADALKEAFKQSGDERAQAAQLKVLGLRPHKPRKLYALAEKDGPVGVDCNEVSARLGTSFREFAAGPAGLLGARTASSRSFRLLADNLPGATAHRSLMQGMVLAPGGVARRPLPPVADLPAEELRAVRERQRLWTLAEARNTFLVKPEQVVTQMGEMLENMPGDAGARVAHGLGRLYASRGQWALARDAFVLLADRHPTHPLTADALRWLLLHQSSGEVRRRYQMNQFIITGQDGFASKGKAPAISLQPFLPPAPGARKAPELPHFEKESFREIATLGGRDEARRWLAAALALEEKLAAFGPLHTTDSRLGFCVPAAKRQLGQVEQAQKWFREFAARQPEGPWRAAALAELWLVNRTGPCPRPLIVARPVEKRPYLDGKLDDDCWQGVSALKMQDASGGTAKANPTEVRMAYDRDYVYLAVTCKHSPGAGTPAASRRTRDEDLRARDRVSLLIDVDRDYATCFHLQVDARGCIADDCWGDKAWGPRWFAAIHRTETSWTVEAAIPRAALSGEPITPGQAWAMNVVRVLPGQGVQAVSLPAEAPESARRPEGMGLLMFALEAKARAERR